MVETFEDGALHHNEISKSLKQWVLASTGSRVRIELAEINSEAEGQGSPCVSTRK